MLLKRLKLFMTQPNTHTHTHTHVYLSIYLYIYIYIYIYNECNFFTAGHLLNPAKSACGNAWGPSGQLQRCKPFGKQKNCFSIGINPIHIYIASQTCCKLTPFIRELTRIICKLLQKDQCNINQRLFAVSRSHKTSRFCFQQTDPTVAVTNMLGLKSVLRRCQVLFSKCLFQDGVLDFSDFECLHNHRSPFFYQIDRFSVICSQFPRPKFSDLRLFLTISFKRSLSWCHWRLPRCSSTQNSCFDNLTSTIQVKWPA